MPKSFLNYYCWDRLLWFVHFVAGKWISSPTFIIYIEYTNIEIWYICDKKYNNLTFYAYVCFLWCSYVWLHITYCKSTDEKHMFSTLIFLSSINTPPRGACGITWEPNFHRAGPCLLGGVDPLFAALLRKKHKGTFVLSIVTRRSFYG